MKRLIGLVFLALVLDAGIALAAGPEHYQGSLGFHHEQAPLGGRWWLSDKVGIDAGFGIGSQDIGASKNLSHWAFDIGVPILLQSWDRVHFILRPGVMFQSQDIVTDPGPPIVTGSDKTTTFGAELEAEVFLADNVSVSGSQGFEVINLSPAIGNSTTDWSTTGANFTSLGLHVYLFGGK
jgi:hypothetical protein